MVVASQVGALAPPGELSDLLARSERNIAWSRAVVESAVRLIGQACRICPPQLVDAGDGPETAPLSVDTSRVFRTWAKMKAGVLPSDGMRRHWIGPGSGEFCNGCGDSITVHETELEGELSDALLLRFHEECFRAWKTFGQARR